MLGTLENGLLLDFGVGLKEVQLWRYRSCPKRQKCSPILRIKRSGSADIFLFLKFNEKSSERCYDNRAHCTFFESCHTINGHVVSIDFRVCTGLLNST
jgi:hypothetical protein